MKTGFDFAKHIRDSRLNQLLNFNVSPAVVFRGDLDDMLELIKIKLISYQDNEPILIELIQMIKRYFSDEIVKELLETTIEEEKIKKIIER